MLRVWFGDGIMLIVVERTDVMMRRLIAGLCSTEERRCARQRELRDLWLQVPPLSVLSILARMRLTPLIGQRLISLDSHRATDILGHIAAATADARVIGGKAEMITLGILRSLSEAGIRSVPIKGSTLARDLYGDSAMRLSTDIDLLVSEADLAHSVAIVERLGWRWRQRAARHNRLPDLHDELVHPTLPNVELHWRVHWYETRFASDALARAEENTSERRLRMNACDEVVSLLLFYARDGFAGMRAPADIASWWSIRAMELRGHSPLDTVREGYPALVPAVEAASALAGRLVGVPIPTHRHSARLRLAEAVADSYLDEQPQQILANASLVDLLLAPPGERRQVLRRELQRVPTRRSVVAGHGVRGNQRLASSEHMIRMSRRWAVGVASAIIKSAGTADAPR